MVCSPEKGFLSTLPGGLRPVTLRRESVGKSRPHRCGYGPAIPVVFAWNGGRGVRLHGQARAPVAGARTRLRLTVHSAAGVARRRETPNARAKASQSFPVS